MLPSELLSGPEKWCKLATALNSFETLCDPRDPDARQWNMEGAIYKCASTATYDHDGPAIEDVWAERLFDAINEGVSSTEWISPTLWEQKPATTFELVIRMLKKAGI